jgi:hypothetical protein
MYGNPWEPTMDTRSTVKIVSGIDEVKALPVTSLVETFYFYNPREDIIYSKRFNPATGLSEIGVYKKEVKNLDNDLESRVSRIEKFLQGGRLDGTRNTTDDAGIQPTNSQSEPSTGNVGNDGEQSSS